MGTKFGTGHTHPKSYHPEIGEVGSHATCEEIAKSLRMAKIEKSLRTAKIRSLRTAKLRSKQTPSRT